jgi:hypothetical protein
MDGLGSKMTIVTDGGNIALDYREPSLGLKTMPAQFAPRPRRSVLPEKNVKNGLRQEE